MASSITNQKNQTRVVRWEWIDGARKRFILRDGLCWWAPDGSAVRSGERVHCVFAGGKLAVTRSDGSAETWTHWVVR